MSGVVKKCDVSTDELIAKALDNGIKISFVQIYLGSATNEGESFFGFSKRETF
jgi:hypothetical protein